MLRWMMVLILATMLTIPLGVVTSSPAAAAGTTTIVTTDRATGQPVLSACYAVADLIRGGSPGGACDYDDGANDGTTTVTSPDPCTSCRFTQGLRDDPSTGLPTDYLVAPPLDTGWGGTLSFQNDAKPYLVVTALDTRTGKLVPGVCLSVEDLDHGGGIAAACDGATGDRDGARNGKMTTSRLPVANLRVHQGTVPPGYLKGASVDVTTAPGGVHEVTLQVPPRPRIAIKTVDRQTNQRLKGACYTIANLTHGGGLGTFCDGQKSGTFGDQDGERNGVIVTRPLDADTTYRLHESKAPTGYRVSPDKDVTTVAGKNSGVVFQNRTSG